MHRITRILPAMHLFPVDEEGVDSDDVDNDVDDIKQFARERYVNHCGEERPDCVRLGQYQHVLVLCSSVYTVHRNIVISSPISSTAICNLTPSTPAVPNCCCSKGSAPYWSNPPFLIFDIRALWRSGLSARAHECQKLKMVR